MMQKPVAYFRMMRRKFSLHRDKLTPQETEQLIRDGVGFTGANLWILVFAILLASLGLNMNSVAVIIGAMLISPLMGPIMGLGLGVAIYDFQLMRLSFRNLSLAVLTSLVASTLYFTLTPFKDAGSELLARTSPSFYDILIAFFGGMAGMVAASSRFRQSNIVPGVAIATALMPPLCTVGYSLANGRFGDALGALYLFCINSVFISLATILVARILRFPFQSYPNKAFQRRMHTYVTITILVTIIPSVFLTWLLLEKHLHQQRVGRFLEAELHFRDRHLVSYETRFRETPRRLDIVMIGRPFDSMELTALNSRLAAYDLQDTRLYVRQQYEDTASGRKMTMGLQTSIEVNAMAIANLYLELDSLRRSQPSAPVNRLPDTLLRSLQAIDSGIQRLSLEPQYSVGLVAGNQVAADTAWLVDLQGTRKPPANRLNELKAVAERLLRSQQVRLQFRVQ